MRDLAGAWVFYSVLPGWPWPQPSFERIARFAPWIGVVIGGLMASLWWLLSQLGWQPAAMAPVVLALGLWLTGGLHLDGLMDTSDGLAAGQARCLEAMDDSRVGASGVQAVVIVLLVQLAALSQLGDGAPGALMLASVAGRVAPLWAMGRFRYLRDGGTAAFHRRHGRGLREAVPTLVLVIISILLTGLLRPDALTIVLVEMLFALCMGLVAAEGLGRRLGGHTGDSYGASVMVCETLTLLGSVLLIPILSVGP